jgi:hypothetical protein
VTKNFLLLSLLFVLLACGKHSHHHTDALSAAPATPVKESVPAEAPLTPKEEKFVEKTKEDLKLSETATEDLKDVLQKTEDPYTKANIMFCAGGGYATMLEFAIFSCRSFKGDRIELKLWGFGVSYAIHSDLLVLYAKKDSRHLKEGTYNVSLSAVHLALGVMGLDIHNDNMSIHWRMKGVTLGLGFNAGVGRMNIAKY